LLPPVIITTEDAGVWESDTLPTILRSGPDPRPNPGGNEQATRLKRKIAEARRSGLARLFPIGSCDQITTTPGTELVPPDRQEIISLKRQAACED
jgi:hypothetical protein